MKTRAAPLLWFAIVVLLAAVFTGCKSRIEQVPTGTGPSTSHLRTPVPGEVPQPTMLERRRLVLEWPQTMREKDSDLIVLSITMDEEGRVTPTVSSGGPGDGTPIEIPDLYETHNIVAVARLDMAGLEAYREDMREPLRPGRTVTFRWSVRAQEAGRYRGVVWLHIEMVPKAGGNVEEILLLARPIEINAVTVLGMPADLARILSLLGVFVSTVLGYPFIQKWIETWRKRKQPQKRDQQEPRQPYPPLDKTPPEEVSAAQDSNSADSTNASSKTG